MKDTFNNVVIYNGYPLSVVVAVTFHSVILALLMYLQSSNSSEALELVQPTVVKALLVQENPQVANERKRLERQQQQQQQRAREQEDARRAAAEAERQRQEQQQAEARAEEQRKARELATLRQRQEQERLDAEQLRRQQEEREAEQRRQREAEQRRQQENLERERQRQQEAADAAAAELATSEFEMVQSGTALIQQIVQEQWSRPPSARNGMRAIIQIRMLPTGDLVDATITQSSGDPAFDRSAENAVYRAAPFRELQTLPINVFNANFRSLSLIFQPEDLLN